ncbi:hypothetical protein KGF57_002100 [Candida theae]|uniref:Uncharacterized protein n=1 Tax=Candida theae TaxID=1198502 RepID=A0AAD5FZB4_9ASCO|nr:uncharacterized protein KGF57_002100 [Candida theae]KAI5959462.1 hypothetical protein KGF57_002100 [Candida theae]
MKSVNVNFITPDELYQLIDFKTVDVTKILPGFDPSAGFMLTSPAYFTPSEANQQPTIHYDAPESPIQTQMEQKSINQVETGLSILLAQNQSTPIFGPTECDSLIVQFDELSLLEVEEAGDQVSEDGYQVSEGEFEVSEDGYQASEGEFEVSEDSYQVSEDGYQASEGEFEASELDLELSIIDDREYKLCENMGRYYTVNVVMQDECPSVQHMTFGECPAWLTQQPNQVADEKMTITEFKQLMNKSSNDFVDKKHINNTKPHNLTGVFSRYDNLLERGIIPELWEDEGVAAYKKKLKRLGITKSTTLLGIICPPDRISYEQEDGADEVTEEDIVTGVDEEDRVTGVDEEDRVTDVKEVGWVPAHESYVDGEVGIPSTPQREVYYVDDEDEEIPIVHPPVAGVRTGNDLERARTRKKSKVFKKRAKRLFKKFKKLFKRKPTFESTCQAYLKCIFEGGPNPDDTVVDSDASSESL